MSKGRSEVKEGDCRRRGRWRGGGVRGRIEGETWKSCARGGGRACGQTVSRWGDEGNPREGRRGEGRERLTEGSRKAQQGRGCDRREVALRASLRAVAISVLSTILRVHCENQKVSTLLRTSLAGPPQGYLRRTSDDFHPVGGI